MNMLQLHLQAVQSPSTVYHEFLLRYKPHEKVVYGLVEGKEDPMFYRGLIEQALPTGWEAELIPAGNRDAVLNSYSEFDWSRYCAERICFFVDRDLTAFCGRKAPEHNNLYVTDNYSIENEVVNFGTFRRVLEEVFNITSLSEIELKAIRAIFDKNSKFFNETLAPIMAQIILWHRAGLNPCLSDIPIKDYFQFNTGLLVLRAQFAGVNDRIAYAAHELGLPVSGAADLESCETEFREKDGPERFVRGKYYLWFFLEFAGDVHRNLPAILPSRSSVPKLKVSLGPKNAMVVIAPRLRCPESLAAFIKQTYVQFASPPAERRSSFWDALFRWFGRLAR